MIKIIKKLIDKNYSNRDNQEIKYIVIHDTGNINTGANAEAHYNYFNNNNLDRSAHYFIDDKEIIQIIEDKNRAWHCGDGKGENGITNDNSIGIEICVNKDGDYNKALENAEELTAYLLNKYNLDITKVVRHFDASGKACPHSMLNNNWDKWQEFKIKVTEKQESEKIHLSKENINKYINGTYKTFLQRDPEQEGFNYWSNKIINLITLKEFLNTVIDSPEFKELNKKEVSQNEQKGI